MVWTAPSASVCRCGFLMLASKMTNAPTPQNARPSPIRTPRTSTGPRPGVIGTSSKDVRWRSTALPTVSPVRASHNPSANATSRAMTTVSVTDPVRTATTVAATATTTVSMENAAIRAPVDATSLSSENTSFGSGFSLPFLPIFFTTGGVTWAGAGCCCASARARHT